MDERFSMTHDVIAVTQLVLHERQGRDREWWDAMHESYAPDSVVRLSWFRGSGPEFVAQSQRMAGRGDRAIHRLGPPIVDVHGERALVELPAVIEVTTELDDVETVLASCARLLYRAVKTAGEWRIVSLDPVYERDTLTPAVPGSDVRVDMEELKRYRVPYRFLAYVLRHRGYDVGDDLYGDDRPDEVVRLYGEAHLWLNPSARTPWGTAAGVVR
ncbi:nuclear transport factor 2 family protein [Streptomyces sp. NPDC006285]|uniref:nuclear transport factor 2 family protein n=1 Tax=Streptomyces sp. NPDC006285 TaxID=3364742 RepID=UPI003699616A